MKAPAQCKPNAQAVDLTQMVFEPPRQTAFIAQLFNSPCSDKVFCLKVMHQHLKIPALEYCDFCRLKDGDLIRMAEAWSRQAGLKEISAEKGAFYKAWRQALSERLRAEP